MYRWFYGSQHLRPRKPQPPGRAGLPPGHATDPSGLGRRAGCGAEKGRSGVRRGGGPGNGLESWGRSLWEMYSIYTYIYT